jgi:hypothetical protein
MQLKDIYYNLESKSSIGLPIICFSITDNNLYITTKKVGSRFFEHLTDETTYIEFRVKTKISCSPDEISNGIEFYDYIFEYFECNSILTIEEFFGLLKIQNITDITTNEFSNNWHVIFATRDPIIRLLSGYTELVDSMLSDCTKIEDATIYNTIDGYAKISKSNNHQFSLKYFSKIDSNKVLNYFSNKVEGVIISDEHTSNWNTFIFYVLAKCKGNLKIIDIDNINDMSIYGHDDTGISNKNVYLNWLEDHSNDRYIINFFNTLNYFILPEYINYTYIKSLK